MVVLMSLRIGFPGEGGALTLQNFVDVYADTATYEIVGNTLLFALGSVPVALLFAVPLSWLLMRTDIPFKKTFTCCSQWESSFRFFSAQSRGFFY